MKTTILINSADTTAPFVAIASENQIWKKFLAKDQKSSQGILPVMQTLLIEQKIEINEVSAIEFYAGPGSFTGLRVGAAIASALSLLLNIPINNLPPGSVPKLEYGQDLWGLEKS